MATPPKERDLVHGVMSFGDHLEELRRRVVLCLVVPLPAAILLFIVAPDIRNLLTAPALIAMEANGLPARMQAFTIATATVTWLLFTT